MSFKKETNEWLNSFIPNNFSDELLKMNNSDIFLQELKKYIEKFLEIDEEISFDWWRKKVEIFLENENISEFKIFFQNNSEDYKNLYSMIIWSNENRLISINWINNQLLEKEKQEKNIAFNYLRKIQGTIHKSFSLIWASALWDSFRFREDWISLIWNDWISEEQWKIFWKINSNILEATQVLWLNIHKTKQDLIQSEIEKSDLKQENNNLEKDLKIKWDENLKLEENILKLEKNISLEKKSKEEKIKERDDLEKKLLESEKKKWIFSKIISKISWENKKLKEKIFQLNSEINKKDSKINSLEDEIENLKNDKSELTQRFENSQKFAEENWNKVLDLRVEKSDLEKKLETEKDNSEKTLNWMVDYVDFQNQEIKDLQSKVEEFEKWFKEIIEKREKREKEMLEMKTKSENLKEWKNKKRFN